MSITQKAAILFDTAGVEMAVQDAVVIPAGTRAYLLAGRDGTTARVPLVDSSARYIVVGAGTAGTPVGGVASVQGVVGGTALPISAVALPLPAGAAQEHILATSPHATRLTDGAAFYDAAKTGQLPATLVGGRLDVIIGSWLGSTAPTVGQKASAVSLPVVIASDQSAVPISAVSLPLPTGAAQEHATAASPHSVRLSDGAAFYNATTSDQLPAVLVDDRLDVNVGAWLGSTAPTVGQKASADSLPVVISNDQSAVPISAAALPLPTGAAQEHAIASSPHAVRLTDGSSFYDATKTGQLPAALVGGRLDQNLGSWLGATTPTVGQKSMAASLPVVLANDQGPITVTGSISALNPSVDDNDDVAPTSSTQVGGTDGTNLQAAQVFDVDSDVGTAQFVFGVSLRKTGSGGSVELGTVTDPVRTDPVGTTAQPVTDSGGSLTVDSPQFPGGLVGGRFDINVGSWFTSTAPTVGQKSMANSIPVVVSNDQSVLPISAASLPLPTGAAQEHATAGSPSSTRLSDGSAFYDATKTGQLPTSLVSGRLDIHLGSWLGATSPTVGQKTMAASLPVVVSSDQTTLPISAASLPLPAGAAQEHATAGSPHSVRLSDGSAFYDSTKTGQLPTSLVGGRLDTNTGSWLGSTTPTVGQKTSANSLPVVVSSDQSVLPVQTEVRLDFDTTVATQNLSMVGVALPSATGAVIGGTAANPLRVDPTGSTAQPVTDNGGSLTVDTGQLPAALVGGRLDANVGAWLGSTAPTVGQKSMANSLPVVLANDQSPIAVTGTISATNPSVSTTGAAVPASATFIGGSDGTNLQGARVFDADSGGGTQYVLGAILRKSASGGSVEAGTSADPLRTDPTGTTAQPVTDNGGTLTVDTPQLPAALVGGRLDVVVGSWFGSSAPTVGQKTMANSLPVVIASDQGGIAVSGTVTANIGTTGGLALDATLTGGTQQSINRGGAKGATVAATVTSTAEGADHQALDVQNYHGGVAVNPADIRALTSVDIVTAAQGAPSNAAGAWFVKNTDGTNVATVKAASTAPVAADPALVVALSPNLTNVVMPVRPGGLTGSLTSATFNSISSSTTADLTLGGNGTFQASSGTFVGTVVVDYSIDGGISYQSTCFINLTTGERFSTLYVNRFDPTTTYGVVVPPGAQRLRARVSSYMSGSMSVLLGASQAAQYFIESNVTSWLGSGAPTVGAKQEISSLPVVLATDHRPIPVYQDDHNPFLEGIYEEVQELFVELVSSVDNLEPKKPVGSETTYVSAATTTKTLLDQNSGRAGATIFNESTAAMKLKLGPNASATSYTVLVVSGAYYELPFNWKGIVTAFWASTNAGALVTELH